MSDAELMDFLRGAGVDPVADRLDKDLDRLSPEIAAQGSDAPGPERPYVRALKALDSEAVRSRMGAAVNDLLLNDVIEANRGQKVVRKPYLVFNLLILLETVPMPEARPALAALQRMKQKLQEALRSMGEDLYRQLLRTLAANQGDPPQTDLWKSILRGPETDYYRIAEIGLREAGWEAACEALPLLWRVYDRPAFELAVMLLIDSYPEADWPECARPHLRDRALSEDIYRVILKYCPGRMEMPLDRIEPEPRTALADLRLKLGEQRLKGLDSHWPMIRAASMVLTKV